jgi:hypothetical protein
MYVMVKQNESKTEFKKLCRITMEDDQGNSVTLVVNVHADVKDWIAVFRKILAFQEFHPDTINGYLGE